MIAASVIFKMPHHISRGSLAAFKSSIHLIMMVPCMHSESCALIYCQWLLGSMHSLNYFHMPSKYP